MNQDIWPIAVSHFYDLASEHRWVDGGVGWATGDQQFHNAQGRLEPYTSDGGVVGLRGTLDRPIPNYPSDFQQMALELEKQPGTNATLNVANTATSHQRSTDDAYAAYPWFGNSAVSWIFQNWPGQDYVDVWLIDRFANAILMPIAAVVEAASEARRFLT